IAPSVSTGILSTAWEESVSAILLGWPRVHETPDALAQERTIETIVRRASQEILVLHGELPPAVHTVLVPMTSEAHEIRALKLGQALKQSADDVVMAIQPVRERLTEEAEASLTEQMQQNINKLDDTRGISGQVMQIANTKDAFVRASEQYDLMIVGMSDEGYLATTSFGGGPVELAEEAASPTILIKSAERRERFFIRRVWQELTELLPTVDKRQQAAVYLGARRDAKATVDFYVLILLATTIAYFGLLQNSSAVIIGAMLIAPLMSPILAMAHGIVQGNSKLLKQAANTTFNGILLAIGTAVIFSFGLTAFAFPIPPTSEILARTQPNILDMMVALASGAAAAYAVSRKEVASALPGVAIAAALVPPLAVVGYGLGSIQFDLAAGALLLFVTNLAAIILAGAITFLSLGFRPPTRVERGEQTRYGLRLAVVAMVIISIPLLFTTVVSNRQAKIVATIAQTIETHWLPAEAQVENLTVSRERSTYVANFEVYDFTGTITTNDMITLQRQVQQTVGETVVLRAVILDGQLDVVDDNTPLIPSPTITPTYAVTPTPPAVIDESAMPLAPTIRPTAAPDAAETETAVSRTPEP
ncbi:MAG: TIGR00341 family protein, partial [Anaerolineae bacterium]|nr:TIGR00341 family protein [Anaerolineae bacterium]